MQGRIQYRHVLCVCIGMSLGGHCYAQSIEISGAVTTDAGKEISGVQIRVYRDGRNVAETRTEKDGTYRIQVDNGKPIDTIRYDHTEWHPGLVNELFGAKGHVINKVLYPSGAKLVDRETAGQLLVYEGLYWLHALSPEGINLVELREEYAPRIRSIMASNKELIGKRSAVLLMYGVKE